MRSKHGYDRNLKNAPRGDFSCYVKKVELNYKNSLSSYSPPSRSCVNGSLPSVPLRWGQALLQERFLLFMASVFLVSVPVFAEAPLVRWLPALSLLITGLWFGIGIKLYRSRKARLWGDLLIGFAWTWLAGSVYWGWLRWEPLLHLPVEAIGLPFVLVLMARRQSVIGCWFYLGSLFGTAVTDLYFYATDLVPFWRQLMQVEPESASLVLRAALGQVLAPTGFFWASLLATVLLLVGTVPLQYQQLRYWGFAGAVLSTILVDTLFLLAAIAA
ncbi:MAG: DUF3120 domain-containing protein [Synechococcales cyanobacterium T60_A2020_003]|nr:DUF3120 domain-containing protein [Synechococcales cyanobacterium T60_A2020_003]